jgi:peptide-methionine (S)-S-oxide reductase
MRTLIIAAAFATLATIPANAETAVFAGGCFWCVEKDLDHVKGVTSTTSGYAGGTKADATYTDHEGNQEAVKVEFDPAIISYDSLVNHFLRTVDVTDAGGQFCDRGDSYTTAIFTFGNAQLKAAEAAIKRAEKDLGQSVATPVKPFSTFTEAEDYHQDYYLGENLKFTRFGLIKQSDAYARYRKACGRDARVKEVWGSAAYSYPAPQGSGS